MTLTRNLGSEASRKMWEQVEDAATHIPYWVLPNIDRIVEDIRKENQVEITIVKPSTNNK